MDPQLYSLLRTDFSSEDLFKVNQLSISWLILVRENNVKRYSCWQQASTHSLTPLYILKQNKLFTYHQHSNNPKIWILIIKNTKLSRWIYIFHKLSAIGIEIHLMLTKKKWHSHWALWPFEQLFSHKERGKRLTYLHWIILCLTWVT